MLKIWLDRAEWRRLAIHRRQIVPVQSVRPTGFMQDDYVESAVTRI